MATLLVNASLLDFFNWISSRHQIQKSILSKVSSKELFSVIGTVPDLTDTTSYLEIMCLKNQRKLTISKIIIFTFIVTHHKHLIQYTYIYIYYTNLRNLSVKSHHVETGVAPSNGKSRRPLSNILRREGNI